MKVSVVIPTLNEALRIEGALESVVGPEVEAIVVDGGSRDATIRLARDAGALVLDARREVGGGSGRAHQLRLGGERAKGEVVLFLHADTRLAVGWREAVLHALADPAYAGGAFRLRFDTRGPRERWIEAWAALRVRLFRLPYGDQALFLRRDVLENMGGVPVVPMMEDLDLVSGIKRAGRLALLPQHATTSARRYLDRGSLKTLFWHQVALLGWVLGWDRARLARRMGR